MTYETLLLDRADGVVTITLSRPQRKNAINGRCGTSSWRRSTRSAGAPRTGCVVLTGAGGDFCSGADLGRTTRRRASHTLTAMRHVGDVALALHRLPQPTLAKVRGVAVGAG